MGEGNGNGQYTVADFLPHIAGSKAIVSVIARRAGCDWHTARKYIDKFQTLKQAFEDERQKNLDTAETTVLKAIEDGDVGTARWYLATIGKDRGYTERQELSGPDGQTLTFRVVYGSDGSDDTAS